MLTSKERVQRILARQPVDRIPIGFFAIDFDTVERLLGHETYVRAKAKSQIALWEGRRSEVVQSWIEDTIALYRKLDFVDVINIQGHAGSLVPPKNYEPEKVRRVDENTWEAKDGRVWKYSSVTADLTLVYEPERTWKIEDFDLDETPPPTDPSIFEVVDRILAEFGETRYMLGPTGGEAGFILPGGMERGLMLYATQPELIQRMIDYQTHIGNLRDADCIRPGCSAILWAEDFAYNKGPFISPAMFRRFCLPSIKERVQAVKARGLPVWKHACGNNWKLLDMFVEAGYDVYQSIQASAGMDLGKVKEKYGDKLVLWGGVKVENLVSGTPEDVRRDVENAFQIGSNGGFIFGDTHSIAVGTRYDNFMTLLDTYFKLSALPPQRY